jgi:Protein of unknown function (DUF402)
MRRFEPGEVVVLREIWDGRVWSAIPARLVEDSGDRRMLFVGPGTTVRGARGADGGWLRLPTEPWTLEDRARASRPILSFALEGIACGFLLMWDEDWRPLHWYLNLEAPLRPSPVGFDYTDHVLDVLVSIDGSAVDWKDERELETAIALGLFSADEGAAFRVDGERAVDRLRSGRPPFDRDWTSWRPDPAWRVPRLPAGWQRA